MSDKKEKAPPAVEDRKKRALFRLLVSPVLAATKGYELPPDHASKNPPQKKRVLRAGANAEVLGLLGPLAKGEPAPGNYLFHGAQVGAERIDFVFDRAGVKIRVSLTALDTTEGLTHAKSASFRITVDGDAPETDRIVVGARVARDVIARDRGQLWVIAADAPPPSPTR